jgi:hypothetical protein
VAVTVKALFLISSISSLLLICIITQKFNIIQQHLHSDGR